VDPEDRLAKVSVSGAVPADPTATWALAADVARFGEWLALHEGWRGASPAEITEGMELTSVVSVKGLRNRVRWRVDRHEPPHLLAISGRGVGGTRITLTLDIRANGSGSTIAVDAEVTGPATIGPIGLVIGRAVRSDLRKSVAKLGELLG
jgi:hypothetical protein